MTSASPPAIDAPVPSAIALPTVRPLTRQEAHDRLRRLCEAVLRRMARRRMH